jgi:type IV fimbrial biogenesis protein FimT
MRHLNPPRAERGLTLVELMVGLTISAVLLVAAGPAFNDYIVNSRLRENGNTVYGQLLLAQSEAIKRNTTIRLSTRAGTVQVQDVTDPDNVVVLHERTLTHGTVAGSTDIDFGGEGRPVNFVAGAIDLSIPGVECSTETRCPGLRIDGGGAVRMCGDHTTNCT